ncbi:MAG: hypothetical protein VB070_12180 [Clostridiaceae bacterium]|nr:hypothetical protein [Clostridiaceae bacterium]
MREFFWASTTEHDRVDAMSGGDLIYGSFFPKGFQDNHGFEFCCILYGFGLIIFIIGLVLVYLGLLLTQSPECGIAVAIVYLAAIISIQGHGKQ